MKVFRDGFYTFINGAIKIYNKIPFVDKLDLLETRAIAKERAEGVKGSEGTNLLKLALKIEQK